MEKEVCRGCRYMRMCLTPMEICPCKICLIKVICTVMCYERHCIGADHLRLKPLTKKEFEIMAGRFVK